MQMEKTIKHYIVAKDGKIVSAGTIPQPETEALCLMK